MVVCCGPAFNGYRCSGDSWRLIEVTVMQLDARAAMAKIGVRFRKRFELRAAAGVSGLVMWVKVISSDMYRLCAEV
jgi:hypothetical protein